MKKFRKKPIVIEAEEWHEFGDVPEAGIEEDYYMAKHIMKPHHCYIETLEGRMYITQGDYIIKGVKGEFYPCKPDIFHTSYEEVKGE